MKSSTIIFAALIALSAAFFVWALTRPGTQASPAGQNTAGDPSTAAAPLEGKTSDEGGVQVSVQPLDVRSTTWTFGVVMNTHAGSLDADLAASATLADERGNVFPPMRWEGAPPGGHHREGTLAFPAIAPRPDSITLTIRNVGDEMERKFTWQLKNR